MTIKWFGFMLRGLRRVIALGEVTQERMNVLQRENIELKKDVRTLYKTLVKQGERLAALEAVSKDAEERIMLKLANRYLRSRPQASSSLLSDGDAENFDSL